MPEPGEKVLFNNYRKQLKAPYIIYADFESIIRKIEGPNLDPEKRKTQRIMRSVDTASLSWDVMAIQSHLLSTAVQTPQSSF